MKKGLCLLFVSLLFLSLFSSLFVVNAQVIDDPSRIQNFSNSVNQAVNNPNGTSNYLANELTIMLLKNPTIAKIDSVLQKVSLFFTVVFGEPFSFSIRFFCVLVFTIYFFFFMRNLFSLISPFGSVTNLLIVIGFSLGISRLKLLGMLGGLIQSLILDVPWWAKILILIVIIIAVKIGDKTFGNFINKIKMKKEFEKEQEKKEELDQSLKQAETVINPYVDALSKVSGIDEGDRVKISLKPLGNATNNSGSSLNTSNNNGNFKMGFKDKSPSLKDDDGERHRGGGGD